MSRRRPATRADHRKFCLTEGWEHRTDAVGRRGTHHVQFEFELPDGRILYTRISHPVDRTVYGPGLFSHILRDQLEVDREAFWACVEDQTLPDRGGGDAPAGEVLPAEVVYTLVYRAGVSEAEVMAMTRAEALDRLTAYYAAGFEE